MAETKESVLSVHLGQVLMRLSETYPRLLETILEMIQNAIDGGATRVYVELDLAAKKRWALIADNGEGISPDKFSEALKLVGESQKLRENTLGRFGLGLISPLAKVTKLRIASFTKGRPVIEWVFNPDKISKMAEGVSIPSSRLSSLPTPKGIWEGVNDWQTCIRLEGITTDRTSSHIDLPDLKTRIDSGFGEAMRRRGTVVKVKIRRPDATVEELIIEPLTFTGIPFEEVTYQEVDAGDVSFSLYRALAPAGQKPKGKVNVRQGGDMFALPWSDFARQARGRQFGGPWLDALGGGFFEGDIEAEGVELAKERNKFLGNDALIGLYACMEQWYNEVGKAYLDSAAEEHKSERLQQLGNESMERLKKWLNANPLFQEAMQDRFVFGETGDEKPTDDEDGKPGSTGLGGGGEGGGTGGGKPPEPKTPPGPRPPTGTTGSGGQRTKPDKGPPSGLVIVHEPLDSPNLWELDMSLGKLYFNTSHKLWSKCEPRDAWVLKLQDYVLMQVLQLLMQPEDLFLILREFADMELCFYIEQFIVEGR